MNFKYALVYITTNILPPLKDKTKHKPYCT